MRVLLEQSSAQLSRDGVHFELSTCYHRYTVETYVQFALLATRNGLPVPKDLWTRLESMVEFLIAIRRPDGSLHRLAMTTAAHSARWFAGLEMALAGYMPSPPRCSAVPTSRGRLNGDVSHLIWMRGTAGLDGST